MRLYLVLLLLLLFICQIFGDELDDLKCGGLPRFSQYGNAKQPYIADGLPFDCFRWNGQPSCCSVTEIETALSDVENSFSEMSVDSGSLSDSYCFYGYYQGYCKNRMRWLTCAKYCDPLFPRNMTTTLPKGNVCYERFAARRGIDAVLYSDPATPCEQAKMIKDLGECGAVVVVGIDNIAIAVGNNEAICESCTAKTVAFSSVLIFLVVFWSMDRGL